VNGQSLDSRSWVAVGHAPRAVTRCRPAAGLVPLGHRLPEVLQQLFEALDHPMVSLDLTRLSLRRRLVDQRELSPPARPQPWRVCTRRDELRAAKAKRHVLAVLE
jgi:hypothetical protein